MILRLEIPRELKSPNRMAKGHWSRRHRESQEWEKFIWVAVLQQRSTVLPVTPVQAAVASLKGQPIFGCQEKRRVSVIRECPSKRNFIKDDDNLRYSVKQLNDAIKRLGLIRDDSRKWLEQSVTQAVSSDGRWRTVIEIEAV